MPHPLREPTPQTSYAVQATTEVSLAQAPDGPGPVVLMPLRVRGEEFRTRVRTQVDGWHDGDLAELEVTCQDALARSFEPAARLLLAESGGVHTVALVALDEAELRAWARRTGVVGDSFAEIAASAECHHEVGSRVRSLETGISTFRSIAAFGILSVPAAHLVGSRTDLLLEHADLVAQLWEASQRGVGRPAARPADLGPEAAAILGNDPYLLLGVRTDAGSSDLRSAYRAQARRLHPDVSPAPDAADRFHAVAQAYRTLSDPGRRARADYERGVALELAHRKPGARTRPRPGGDVVVAVPPEDLLAGACSLAYDALTACLDCGTSGVTPGARLLTCQECGGGGHLIHVQATRVGEQSTWRPCSACHGYGSVPASACRACDGSGRRAGRRTLRVRMPAGIGPGDHLLLSGGGHVGAYGGAAGDLYLTVRQASPRLRAHRAPRGGLVRSLLRH